MAWKPTVGAWREGEATRFRIWAPEVNSLELVLESAKNLAEYPLEKSSEGFFSGLLASVAPGDLYRYRIDGKGPYPDPASRFQPQGVHGPSQVVDPDRFGWSDQNWAGIGMDELVLYELHVGAFTPEGTFQSAQARLPVLRDLGVTAVELMPVADFAGDRNWGYDGVALFAPARCYGTPDDLRRFVNAAHRLGLAVFLDVVYNHLGPDGAYHSLFSPYYFSKRHRSPWGAGINFDGELSRHVRRFFIENALHWVHDYHVDGLRLDATHAIVDDSARYFLAELSTAVHESMADSSRRALLVAEDTRNLDYMMKPESEKGWGMDGAWSDDFHHQVRRCLAGDSDGYFADFTGTPADVAATLRQGWFYCGQHAQYFGGPRGTDPTGLSPSRFVFFTQNHDQVGNRAMGDRLHHQVDLASCRAAVTLLLLGPETPLLFMGQEWAAGSPFLYFTDHHAELGRLVTDGRRREFSRFAAFSDPKARERIPDPQSPRTFEASRLDWEEREREPHASTLRLYVRLLALRRAEPALRARDRSHFEIDVAGDETLVLKRWGTQGRPLLIVVRLRGAGETSLAGHPLPAGYRWVPELTTEDAAFAPAVVPLRIDSSAPAIGFLRPGAAVLKGEKL